MKLAVLQNYTGKRSMTGPIILFIQKKVLSSRKGGIYRQNEATPGTGLLSSRRIFM